MYLHCTAFEAQRRRHTYTSQLTVTCTTYSYKSEHRSLYTLYYFEIYLVHYRKCDYFGREEETSFF